MNQASMNLLVKLIPIVCIAGFLATIAWWIRSRHHFDEYTFRTSTKAFTVASYNGRFHADVTSDLWQSRHGWWHLSDEGEYGVWQCQIEWPVYEEDAGRTWFIGRCHREEEFGGPVQFYVVAFPLWSIMLAAFLPLAALFVIRFNRRRKNTRRGFAVLFE